MSTSLLRIAIALLLLSLVGKTVRAQQPSQTRPLPPSMRIELARENAKAHKAIIFRDTVKSAQLQSALSRDTSRSSDSLLNVVKDSALATVDSAVAEPVKAHLDSAIAELPEFSRNDNKPHFEYLLSIMTEPYRTPVPFDTSILRDMNPVSRENLPYFDQHPMPLPLQPEGSASGHVRLGLGSPHLPYIEAGYERKLDERWALDLGATVINNVQSDPLEFYWNGEASVLAELGDDPSLNRSTSLAFNLSTTGKALALYRDTTGTKFQMNHTVSLESISAALTGQWADHSDYSVSAGLHSLTDNLTSVSAETTEWLAGHSAIRFTNSDFGMEASLGIQNASAEEVILPAPFIAPTANGLFALNSKLRISDAGTSGIVWTAGLNLASGSDITGSQSAKIFPAGSIKFQITPDWKVGASFDPEAHLIDLAALVEESPFFTPLSAMEGLVKDSASAKSTEWQLAAADPRRVAIDQFNLKGFTSYTLSADDEIHAQIEIADRQNNPVFYQHILDSSGKYSFYALSEETRQLTLSAGANLLVFTSDILTLDLQYNSEASVLSGASLPFEPVLKVHVGYSANGLSNTIKPRVEIDYIGLQDHSLAFLNFRLDILLSTKFAILLRCENLLGGRSDYWTGYNEMPRSVWAAINYKF